MLERRVPKGGVGKNLPRGAALVQQGVRLLPPTHKVPQVCLKGFDFLDVLLHLRMTIAAMLSTLQLQGLALLLTQQICQLVAICLKLVALRL